MVFFEYNYMVVKSKSSSVTKAQLLLGFAWLSAGRYSIILLISDPQISSDDKLTYKQIYLYCPSYVIVCC